MSGDDSFGFDDAAEELTDDRARSVDEIGWRAGASLRRPAPEGGAAGVARSAHIRRVVRAGGVTVVALAAVTWAVVAIDRPNTAEPTDSVVTEVDSTTPEQSTSLPATTAPSVTSVESTLPDTTPPDTTPAPISTAGPTEVSPLRSTDSALSEMMMLDFSADGSRLIGVDQGRVVVVDVSTLQVVSDRTLDGGRYAIVNDDGTSAFDGTTMWDLTTGGSRWQLEAAALDSGTFSPDGAAIAIQTGRGSGGRSGPADITVFDAATGEPLYGVEIMNTDHIHGIRFSPDGTSFLTMSGEGASGSEVWSTASGERLFDVPAMEPVEYTDDGRFIVAGGASWYVFDASTGRQLLFHPGVMAAGYETLGLGGTRLMVSTPHEDSWTTVIYDTLTGDRLQQLDGLAEPSMLTRERMVSRDGTRIVAPRQDGSVVVFEVVSGAPLATLVGHSGRVASMVFSPDGATIITIGADGTMKLWQSPTTVG